MWCGLLVRDGWTCRSSKPRDLENRVEDCEHVAATLNNKQFFCAALEMLHLQDCS